ncbi:GT2 family glycosyltransferase [Agrobacterium tumefaciens]|uniref:GT2 family glycosyltransferase n=1 Tax=Agrobacterium tumefaciens TaxID=358 RepID=A0AAW8LXW0_AGRTU|nr:glycosyltransferase [Agrobacterium tumefaciens]MBP2566435.1 GT2 family glycosyltransferase [Agrobacterium tumefaciens]MDR6703737.1 GT2 family glycosyltransferase [Agrobacterium tumefaciens]
MENSREIRISDKYKELLSVATERVNIHSAKLGNKDFDIQYRLLEYTEAENGRRILELEKKIDDLTDENIALRADNQILIDIHRQAQILARRAGRFPFSIYFRVKKKYRRILRSIRNLSVSGSGLAGNLATSAYDVATQNICQRFGSVHSEEAMKPLHMLVGSEALVRNALERAPLRASEPAVVSPNFSIVTPFFKHDVFFRECAESVSALFNFQASKNAPDVPEWVIVNDDPDFSREDLLTFIPAQLRPHVRIISDGKNIGIAAALNKGIRSARNAWVMLLDCDDMIEANAVDVVTQAIRANPGIRYFSSAMIDIDEAGAELRKRRQDYAPTEIFSAGMVMGHLVTFSVELFEEYGGFNETFSGVQDYDLALRVAAKEKLGRISDHLYRYRWHGGSVSVSSRQRQARLTDKVRAAFFRDEFKIRRPLAMSKTRLRENPTAVCIIRTQGKRMELLASAVESVRSQSIMMTPCIVVHGDVNVREFVERNLPRELLEGTGNRAVILCAPDLSKRRGYPCNVGLQYLKDHAAEYDFLCFLDDDDHLLPRFGEQLADAVEMNDADFAYGLTNALPQAGAPFIQHNLLPATALFIGNFIPVHSYLLRTEVVLKANLSFDEGLDYLEDWDFLIQIIGSGAKGVPLFEVVSEYRLLGDGNTNQRNDPAHFEDCTNKVVLRGKSLGKKIQASQFWAEVLEFPTDRRKALNAHEIAHLNATRNLFQPLEIK